MKALYILVAFVLLTDRIHGENIRQTTPTNKEYELKKRDSCTGKRDEHEVQPLPKPEIEEIFQEVMQSFNQQNLEAVKNTEQRVMQDQPACKGNIMTHYGCYNPDLSNGEELAKLEEKLVEKLAQKKKIPLGQAAKQLEGKPLPNNLKGKQYQTPRPEAVPCEQVKSSRYRTIDGECNNLQHQTWGATNTPFTRIVCPDYADSFKTPRIAKDGTELTNARKVVLAVFGEQDVPSVRASHLLMLWGQFLDHDIAHGAQPKDVDCTGKCADSKTECFGIPIDQQTDPDFKGVDCLNMIRNVPFGKADDGKIHPQRDQVNQKTSFIDASQVYGDEKKIYAQLRDPGDKCLLLVQGNSGGGKNLLPEEKEGFCRSDKGNKCFMSGDGRTNENLGLTSMHTMFAREHNRIAKQLRQLNSHWDCDKIFNETRHIVGAMMQHITYNEFLTTVLDPETLNSYHLNLPNSFYNCYMEDVDPGIINSFATAAYRFGHSLIKGTMTTLGIGYCPTGGIPISNSTFNPDFLYQKGGADQLLRGFARDHSRKLDNEFDPAIMSQLVIEPKKKTSLPTLNVQRGREHGLPGYNTFRQLCNLPYANSFDEFKLGNPHYTCGTIMSDDNIANLKEVYNHPDDVDLFVGMLLETPLGGGMAGPTLACLLGEQFFRLRHGDRYWYELRHEAGAFNIDQLWQIKQATLARIICDNADHIEWIQPWAMLQAGTPQNEPRKCDCLPRMDLTYWKSEY